MSRSIRDLHNMWSSFLLTFLASCNSSRRFRCQDCFGTIEEIPRHLCIMSASSILVVMLVSRAYQQSASSSQQYQSAEDLGFCYPWVVAQ